MKPVYIRKLVRIALAGIAVILLFNFIAYYLVFSASKENKCLSAVVSTAASQRVLSQRISTASLLLVLNTGLSAPEAAVTHDRLNNALNSFEKQQQYLAQQLALLQQQRYVSAQLLPTVDKAGKSLLATGRELAAAPADQLQLQAADFSTRIRQEESIAAAALDAVNRECVPLLTGQAINSSKLNMNKLVSLLIALACLAILVIEPLLRSNKKNLTHLQLAKVELLQEKKYLSSILNSQTNYVIRLNRQGNFTFANPAFMKTFGHATETLLQTAFYNTIFTKDIQRCTEVAEQCWQNPGKIFRILIRKPINKSKSYLWTEWEFIALSNEDNSITEIQGIGLDVSDKILAQQSKEEAIQTLSYAMSYARMGAWKYNLETREFSMSAEMKSLLGLTPEDPDIISMEDFVYNYVLPEDVFIVAAETEKILRNKDTAGYESAFSYRITTRQGQVRYLFTKGKKMNEQFRFGIAQDITTLKESEQALLKSEQQYRLLAEHSEDIISVHSATAVTEYISPSVQTVLGYTPEEVAGKNMMEFVHPDDHGRFTSSEDTPSVHNSALLLLRYRMLHKNGSHIWLESIIKPVKEKGEVTKLICTSRNITERKKTEAQKSILLAEIKQSEALLRSIIDATPDLIFIKDSNYRHVLVNKAYADLLHLTPQDIIGKNDIELGFTEEQVKGNSQKGIRGFWQDDDEVMNSGRIKYVNEETAFMGGDLHYFSIVKAPLSDEEGKIWGVLGFAHNITDIKKAEAQKELLLAEVKQSEQLLKTVIDATPDWIFIKDASHRFLMANKAYASSLQLTPEQMIGKNDIDLGFDEKVVKGDAASGLRGFWADDDEVIKTGQPKYMPEEINIRNGVQHYFSTTKVPL
ncbi:MAG TPA: PAS domain S-box protein, partial [Chitinophagaceae bacterium]|nr:PAS domain S-box protein [Chitinophagaceae bacterium]